MRIHSVKLLAVKYQQHLSHASMMTSYKHSLLICSHVHRHAIRDCGTQMLEMDVRRTKDGVVVVSHDMNLARLCGKDARVDELDYTQLPEIKKRVPIAFEPGHFFEGKGDMHDREIPTLENVFR